MAIPDSRIPLVQTGLPITADLINQIISAVNWIIDRIAGLISGDSGLQPAKNQTLPIYIDSAVANETGWYQGKRILPPATAAHVAGTKLAEADLGYKSTSFDCYVINETEISGSVSLILGQIYEATLCGFYNQLPMYRVSVSGGLWAKITGNSQDGSNLRWKYSWSAVAKTSAGFGGWTVPTGAQTGTTSARTAYNTLEDMNGATGTFGNGVASSNLTGTLTVKPAPNNAIVFIRPVIVAGVQEYQFEYSNAIDGGC